MIVVQIYSVKLKTLFLFLFPITSILKIKTIGAIIFIFNKYQFLYIIRLCTFKYINKWAFYDIYNIIYPQECKTL